MGFILLEGGAEFSGRMDLADKRAMSLAGGMDALISIIPAAAAPDNNQHRAGSRGVDWFRRLGATRARALPLVDRTSANEPSMAEELRRSKLIFLLGGFPGYLADTLKDSLSWTAMMEAAQTGAIIAGSSAGAMVLCEFYYDPVREQTRGGLNLIQNACILPHYDTFGVKWLQNLEKMLPETVLIGIDEETGMINDGSKGAWNIYGKGAVTLHRSGRARRFTINEPIRIG